MVERGLEPAEALEEVRASTVFTTHTPVPAGNEIFAGELVLRYVGALAEEAGISREELLALGRADGGDGFGLTPLALRLSSHANAVSELHGEVARTMWKGLWPGSRTDHACHERRPPRHVARSGARPSCAGPASARGTAVERRLEAARELDLEVLLDVRAGLPRAPPRADRPRLRRC